jgi:hypothetical protein
VSVRTSTIWIGATWEMEVGKMSRAKIEVYEKLFATAFAATEKAAGDIAPENRLRQSKDGKAHPLWLLGHLTFATDAIVNSVVLGGETTLPKQYQKLFAPGMIGGADITTDASQYPAWDDIVEKYKAVTANTLALLKKAQDSDLPGGMKGQTPPGFEEFFKSFEGTLGYMLGHDSYHRGQMTLLANA